MEKILIDNNKIQMVVGKIINKTLPTVAFLPDTQSYVNYKPASMVSQIDYLVNNKDSLNIKFVGHEGDIVQNHDSNPYIPTGATFTPTGYTEWSFMQWQMNRLIENGIPYSTLPGNHDYVEDQRNSEMYNSYFPLSSFTGMTTYGGSYDTNSDNTYHIVNMDGHDLLILSLEFGPRTSVLEWADGILKENSTIPAIIVTHAYVSKDNTLLNHDTNHAPSNGYGLGNGPPDVNDAITVESGTTSIYSELVESNYNVRIVISGHDGDSTTGASLVVTGRTDGSNVYQILSNFQYFSVNSSGYLGLLSFSEDKVHFSTYSPTLDSYLVNEYSQGGWDWDW
jgi:hypothetical protein